MCAPRRRCGSDTLMSISATVCCFPLTRSSTQIGYRRPFTRPCPGPASSILLAVDVPQLPLQGRSGRAKD